MLELKVKIRPETGKGNKSIRKEGLVPAVLYGHKTENMPIVINETEFIRVFKEAGESTLIKLSIEGDKKEEKMVLVHDFDKDPLRGRFIHVDFYQPQMDEVISAEVPLEFISVAPAEKDLGGILVKNIHNIEVEALPHKLPRQIEVDLSVLNTFEDAIQIKDLNLPEDVEVKLNPEETVVSVLPPRSESEIEALEETPEENIESVESEEEEKQKVEAEEVDKEQPEE